MLTIAVAASPLGPALSIEGEAGARLLDLCDEARAPLAFACRSADCGTCRVEILEGEPLLVPAEHDESRVLSLLGAPASHRLACQVHLRDGPGRVALRWIHDDPPPAHM